MTALVLVALAATPASSPSVVIVTNHADARIVRFLAAELESLGMRVALVDRGAAEVSPVDLREVARRLGAAAAFRVLTHEEKLEVWVADRVTGKIVLREILDDHLVGRVADREVALRAVELLRASLLESDEPHESRGEVSLPGPMSTVAVRPQTLPQTGLQVGATGLVFPGAPGPLGGLHLEVGVRVLPGLLVSLRALVPLTGSSLTAAEGTVAFSPRVFSATASWGPETADARWTPRVGVGLGAVWLTAIGVAERPLVSRTVNVVLPGVVAHGALGYALTRHLQLVASVFAGLTASWAPVSFAGREVARFGPFFAGASLAIEVLSP